VAVNLLIQESFDHKRKGMIEFAKHPNLPLTAPVSTEFACFEANQLWSSMDFPATSRVGN
jgi:hypothetical protein